MVADFQLRLGDRHAATSHGNAEYACAGSVEVHSSGARRRAGDTPRGRTAGDELTTGAPPRATLSTRGASGIDLAASEPSEQSSAQRRSREPSCADSAGSLSRLRAHAGDGEARGTASDCIGQGDGTADSD